MSKMWKDKSKLCRNMRLRHKKAIKQQAVQIAYSLFLCVGIKMQRENRVLPFVCVAHDCTHCVQN